MREEERSALWPSVWLALLLAATKAAHWSLPGWSASRLHDYLVDVGVSAHADVLFAIAFGLAGQAALLATRRRPRLRRAVWSGLLALGALGVAYAVASIRIFDYLRSPLTYPLLYLAGDMVSMRSSIASFFDWKMSAALVAAPAVYLLGVRATCGLALAPSWRKPAAALGLVAAVGYPAAAWRTEEGKWSDRDDHLIARSPHWDLARSCVEAALGGQPAALAEPFPAEALEDFRARPASPRVEPRLGPRRPRNLVLLVLESTGARYLSLYGSRYATTPNLVAEARHAIVFDHFYCHVGMTANSMAAISLSVFPYMTWRQYTVEYPDFPGRTLADVLRPLGYRTAFIHSGDLAYVHQDRFLAHRGFQVLEGLEDLAPAARISSWGGEDRVLVDGVLRFVDQDRARPFYVMAWTIQSHHPYEPTPGQPQLDFFHGDLPPDDYDLGRYLNTLHEVDRQLGRLFDGLRERGLADDTLVVITGDHGEAFGDPHPTWGHGSRLYEENVHIPLMIWSPRLYASGRRSAAIGSHVDLNPTVLDLLGLPGPSNWEGRSLFDADRAPRAYFYAANDDYLLGVRDGEWKYIFDATRGRDELYDLSRDAEEQHDLSRAQPERCRILRQRLAAWRRYVGGRIRTLYPES